MVGPFLCTTAPSAGAQPLLLMLSDATALVTVSTGTGGSLHTAGHSGCCHELATASPARLRKVDSLLYELSMDLMFPIMFLIIANRYSVPCCIPAVYTGLGNTRCASGRVPTRTNPPACRRSPCRQLPGVTAQRHTVGQGCFSSNPVARSDSCTSVRDAPSEGGDRQSGCKSIC